MSAVNVLTFIEHAKNAITDLIGTSANDAAAEDQKAESDIAADPHVAGLRASGGGTDGQYVGRTTADIDSDVEQSGAEARSENARLSE